MRAPFFLAQGSEPLANVSSMFEKRFCAVKDHASDREDGLDHTLEQTKPVCANAFILPSRLTHTRLSPTFHRWVFPHFLCGVPVTRKGVTADLISTGDLPWTRRNWFRIEADDHLEHWPQPTTLREKLDRCLENNGVNPKTFPYCYFVTPPRFLSFPVFGAVTLWYLYFENQELGALLVEVHNSSQERRNYLLHNGLRGAGSHGEDIPATAIRKDSANYVEFTCEKTFHTTGFTPRNGTYSARVINPFRNGGVYGSVDATITFKPGSGPATVVARLRSCGTPIDPNQASKFRKFILLCRCTYTMLVMWPIIISQLCMLRYVRKLRYYKTPVPLPGSVSRVHTRNEALIESIFRRLLISKIRAFPEAVELAYKSPTATILNPDRDAVMVSLKSACDGDVHHCVLEVLRPSFYSNIIRYSSLRAAIEGEIVREDYSSGTVRVENPDLLFTIMETDADSNSSFPDSPWDRFLLRRLVTLRTSTDLTLLDKFALSECSREECRQYLRMSLATLVDHRSGVGLTRLKIYGLFAVLSLGAFLLVITEFLPDLVILRQAGLYCLILGVISWVLVVSNEDLATLLPV